MFIRVHLLLEEPKVVDEEEDGVRAIKGHSVGIPEEEEREERAGRGEGERGTGG
jgi:hypothetical protein